MLIANNPISQYNLFIFAPNLFFTGKNLFIQYILVINRDTFIDYIISVPGLE